MNDKLWSEFVLTCRKLLEIWQREYQRGKDERIIAKRILWLKSMYDETRENINA